LGWGGALTKIKGLEFVDPDAEIVVVFACEIAQYELAMEGGGAVLFISASSALGILPSYGIANT
jgi:hypothetical protein